MRLTNCLFLLCLIAYWTTGCAPTAQSTGTLTLDQFVSDRPHAQPHRPTATQTAATTYPAATPPPAVRTTAVVGMSYLADAMPGHITGAPIFADAIFQRIGIGTLQRLGQVDQRARFMAEIRRLLANTLQAEVITRLLVAEAKRELTDQQRQVLPLIIASIRQKIINQYGAGSPTLAEQRFEEDNGMSIAEHLRVQRQQLLTSELIRKKVRSKVFVSRRDVARYYDKHFDEFNPKPIVTYRFIVGDRRQREQIDGKIQKGVPFKDLLPDRMRGPYTFEGPLSNFTGFEQFPNVDRAVRQLDEGAVSNAIAIRGNRYIWVKLDKVVKPTNQTLAEVYLQIHDRLYQQRYTTAYQRFQMRLQQEGSYSDPRAMTNILLQVAVTRFAAIHAAH